MPRTKKPQIRTYDQYGDSVADWPVWAKGFLTALADSGNVSLACRAADIGRTAPYVLRDSDPVFLRAWKDAIDEAGDVLEAEAHRRAYKGVAEPIYYQGIKVGTQQRYSDSLMALLLKGAKPEKYRERVDQQISGAGGGPVQTIGIPFDPAKLDGLSDEELALLESIVGKLSSQP